MSRWIVSDGDGSYKPTRLRTTRLFSSRVVTNGALCNKNVRDVYASLFKSGTETSALRNRHATHEFTSFFKGARAQNVPTYRFF